MQYYRDRISKLEWLIEDDKKEIEQVVETRTTYKTSKGVMRRSLSNSALFG